MIDRQYTELPSTLICLVDAQLLLYQAGAPKRIGCLWMSNMIGRKCTEPCITKRIVGIHHWILGLWIGRFEWSKRIHLMLRHRSHLH
uniref:Putative ovule protein n=1 Tax=Solanum chacoense TaxID=4108 RepID=A0A0V0HBT4_SOLCH